MAPRPVAAPGRRADGAPRFGLPRGDGPAQRLAGRRRRRLGTRPLLDRRAAAAGLYPRRRTADRKDPPLGRVGARQPAARRLFRPGGRPPVRKPGHTARQRPRLVAQDGHAQGAATILLGDGRRARHRTDERLFPLPAARASEDPAGALDFLGRTARRRQPGHRLLALQHHGRRIPAGAGRPDPPADARLDGHSRRRGGDPDALLAALREPRAGDQGAGGLLPAQQRPGASGGREERLRGHTPLHRPADGVVRGRRGAARRRPDAGFGALHGRGDDVLAGGDGRNHGRRAVRRPSGARGVQRPAHAGHGRL